MDVEPDPVSGRVLEALSHAAVDDDSAAHVIDGAGRDPRPDRIHAGGLRGRHQVEDVPQSSLGLATDAERPGHVRAIALECGTEVDHHGVTHGDQPIARVMVGLGGVLPRRHDGLEGHRLGTAPPHG